MTISSEGCRGQETGCRLSQHKGPCWGFWVTPSGLSAGTRAVSLRPSSAHYQINGERRDARAPRGHCCGTHAAGLTLLSGLHRPGELPRCKEHGNSAETDEGQQHAQQRPAGPVPRLSRAGWAGPRGRGFEQEPISSRCSFSEE